MGIINKPSTFTANTTISPTEVNDDFDTVYNEFNGNIAAANLATDAVTTAKIADSNVTTAKINDAAVTTAKVNDGAVTPAKMSAQFLLVKNFSGNTLPNGTLNFTAPSAGFVRISTCLTGHIYGTTGNSVPSLITLLDAANVLQHSAGVDTTDGTFGLRRRGAGTQSKVVAITSGSHALTFAAASGFTIEQGQGNQVTVEFFTGVTIT